MTVRESIKKLLEDKGDLSVKEMTDLLEVSKQAIHKSILLLIEAGEITKFGKAPKTIYRLNSTIPIIHQPIEKIDEASVAVLNKDFLLISEVGEMLDGILAFELWCRQRKLPFAKTVKEFIDTKEKYQQYYDANGVINGKTKLANTKGYDKIYLDDIYYLDFYAIERFGKTRLGTLLHYAKQGQNKFLMAKIVAEIKVVLNIHLQKIKPDAVAYVPPTIRREVQIMKYLETHLRINLPKVNIQKISGIIPVPQKSLNKLEERIVNAENTFAVTENIKYKHLLLIDDAVGSGSTLNQIAGKIKQKGIAQKVTGLAIVGSFKGFDVITDV